MLLGDVDDAADVRLDLLDADDAHDKFLSLVNGAKTHCGGKMLLERTELLIKEGQEAAFAVAMKAEGMALLASVPDVVSVNLGRGVENPAKFLLLVEWKNMDAHIAYNKTPVSGVIRALILPFSKGGSMEHFEMG
jgi:heme-degrading monooxygenase HmoA